MRSPTVIVLIAFHVVATSGGKKWLNVHPSVVWTRQDEVSPDEYRKWFEKQPEVTTLKASYTGVYMLVGPDGSATVPFELMVTADQPGK